MSKYLDPKYGFNGKLELKMELEYANTDYADVIISYKLFNNQKELTKNGHVHCGGTEPGAILEGIRQLTESLIETVLWEAQDEKI